MIPSSHAIAIMVLCALCTLLERALPFIIFRGNEVPKSVQYLGNVLPMAIISTLILYCLKDLKFSAFSEFAPQSIASIFTIVLHLWRRNSLLSIFGGTGVCMVLMNIL